MYWFLQQTHHKNCVDSLLAAPQEYVDDTAMTAAGENELAYVMMFKAVKDSAQVSNLVRLKLSRNGVIYSNETKAFSTNGTIIERY